jgi:hypothetical protein
MGLRSYGHLTLHEQRFVRKAAPKMLGSHLPLWPFPPLSPLWERGFQTSPATERNPEGLASLLGGGGCPALVALKGCTERKHVLPFAYPKRRLPAFWVGIGNPNALRGTGVGAHRRCGPEAAPRAGGWIVIEAWLPMHCSVRFGGRGWGELRAGRVDRVPGETPRLPGSGRAWAVRW